MPKKTYQVIKATTREIPGVLVGGRRRHFGPNGTFTVRDPGEAAEIDKVLGMKGTGEVVVTSYKDKEHGHNYVFGSSPGFSRAWEEFEKRRKEKANGKLDTKSNQKAGGAAALTKGKKRKKDTGR